MPETTEATNEIFIKHVLEMGIKVLFVCLNIFDPEYIKNLKVKDLNAKLL